MSVLGKIFSNILLGRLQYWSDYICPLSDSQCGFRKGYRSADNIFILHTIISKYLSRKRGRLYVAFIDFRKAFDYVDRRKLLNYLHFKGLRGNLFKTLISLFKGLQSCVRVNNRCSEFFKCLRGVQQGSPLSPLLFNLFVDSIGDEMCNLTSYGIQLDDTTLTHLFIR